MTQQKFCNNLRTADTEMDDIIMGIWYLPMKNFHSLYWKELRKERMRETERDREAQGDGMTHAHWNPKSINFQNILVNMSYKHSLYFQHLEIIFSCYVSFIHFMVQDKNLSLRIHLCLKWSLDFPHKSNHTHLQNIKVERVAPYNKFLSVLSESI